MLFLNYVCEGYVHVNVSSFGGRRHLLPLELELQPLVWVLALELGSSAVRSSQSHFPAQDDFFFLKNPNFESIPSYPHTLMSPLGAQNQEDAILVTLPPRFLVRAPFTL